VNRCYRWVALCLVAVLALAACSGQSTQSPQGSGEGLASATPSGGAGGFTSQSDLGNESLAPVDPFVEAERLELALLRRVNALRAECVAAEGFSVDLEAQALYSPDDGGEDRGVVSINPAELGPLTRDEAREFGLVGVDTRFGTPEAGVIRSRDPAFSDVMESCREQAEAQVGPDVGEILRASLELRNEAGDAFRSLVAEPLRPVVEERVACFAQQVGVDPGQIMELSSWEEVMALLGVEPGSYAAASDNDSPDLVPAEGETLLLKPAPEIYEPSEAEIEVAMIYADCAQETDLVQRLLDVQEQPRREVLERYGDQLMELTARLKSYLETSG